MPVADPPTGDRLEAEVAELVAYTDELALPGVTRDALRSLLRRVGDVRIAKRRLRDRRDRLGRQIERHVDEAWLGHETEKARVTDQANAAERARDLARVRGQQTIVERLENALRSAANMAALSTPDFVATGSAGGDSARVLPPGGDQDLAEHYWHLLALFTKALERELDRALYGAQAETKDERAARVVRDYPGLPPYLVAAIDRTVGSPYTVERDRHFMGCDMRTGLELPPQPKRTP
jgi:hypothetical protein